MAVDMKKFGFRIRTRGGSVVDNHAIQGRDLAEAEQVRQFTTTAWSSTRANPETAAGDASTRGHHLLIADETGARTSGGTQATAARIARLPAGAEEPGGFQFLVKRGVIRGPGRGRVREDVAIGEGFGMEYVLRDARLASPPEARLEGPVMSQTACGARRNASRRNASMPPHHPRWAQRVMT
jgi:hypothetical protein